MPNALLWGRRAIELYPKNVPQRNNFGLIAMYAATSRPECASRGRFSR
jgi:hypothetical protein